MDDMDLIFLKKDYLSEADLSFLTKIKEEREMLIEINKKIANSVQEEEYEYWKCRRADFYRVGAEFVKETIEEDKKMGILTEGGEWNERD